MPKLETHYACHALTKLDGRTKTARLAKVLRSELLAHVGSRPSVTQRLLIDQAVQLQLRLAAADCRDYVETSMALACTLDRIGIKAVLDVTSPSAPLVAA